MREWGGVRRVHQAGKEDVLERELAALDTGLRLRVPVKTSEDHLDLCLDFGKLRFGLDMTPGLSAEPS